MSDLNSFHTMIFAKCILSGEHAVLRGYPAIIVPIKQKAMNFTFTPASTNIAVEFSGEYETEIQFLFWSALIHALDILKIQKSDLRGNIFIDNMIPVGAGMGASGVVCVAIARWLHYLGHVVEEDLFEFARQLENVFHGESSGADIAAAIASASINPGIKFIRNSNIQTIQQNWKPNWYLSFSGKRSITENCVRKVKDKWKTNPEAAKAIDKQMAMSVELAEQALMNHNEALALMQLKQVITLGYDCFKKWGLCEDIVEQHIQMLITAGALAAKPTGAGDGGFVLSLWKDLPAPDLLATMIAL